MANLTGYRIYYSGADDSGTVDVGASATNITVGNHTAGVTYSITMVALSPHLPSPVVGPINFTLGGYFAILSTLQMNMYVIAIISDRFRKIHTNDYTLNRHCYIVPWGWSFYTLVLGIALSQGKWVSWILRLKYLKLL